MTDKSQRVGIADGLQTAISKALDSYHCFMGQDVPEDAKGFSAHHSAAKVAIAHIELLLKIARSSETEKKTEDSGREFETLLRQAESELKTYKSRQDVWEEEGEDGDNL